MVRVIIADMKERDTQTMGDAELLAISKADPKAFEVLVNRYQRQFVRKAVSILRNEEDAADAVQEAFVRIYMAGHRYKVQEGASFSSWAYTILINQCYTSYRKKHKHELISIDFVPELVEVLPDQAAIEELEHSYIRDQLVSLVSRLPVMLRRVVELHFIEGLPQKVVAEQEGISNAVVRTRIHRAK